MSTVALAFTAGMLAALNPCGFPLLPAYLSFFVTSAHADSPAGTIERIGRAVLVSLTLTVAFVAVFGLVGVTLAGITSELGQVLPWLTMLVGAGLVGVGLWGLSGRTMTLPIPKLHRGGTSGRIGSVFLFGLSYAVSSLSCAIYPFLSIVSASMTTDGIVPGAAVIAAYAGGMASLVIVLTVSVALAQQSLVILIRSHMRIISRAGSLLIVIVGLYLLYYGYYERGLSDSGAGSDRVISTALRMQGWLVSIVDSAHPLRIGLAGLGVAAASGAAAIGLGRRRRSTHDHG